MNPPPITGSPDHPIPLVLESRAFEDSTYLMPNDLRRSMTLPHATAIVAGIIIGASIFIQPSEVTRLVPSPRGVMLVWLAAGALTFCGALVCAEFATAFPQTGGVYIFLKKTFSPALGFLWGWTMFWIAHSGIIAALAVILARYVGYFVPLGEPGTRAVAIGAVILLSTINYFGVKSGGALQLFLTAAKLAAIAALVVLLFAFGRQHPWTASAAADQPISLSAYGLATAAGLFAFGGFHLVTYVAGEVRDPERTIPRALLIGTLVVTAVYMLLNAAYLFVLPLGEVARSTRVAAEVTEKALGAHAGGAIAALVILSAAGSLNGVILSGPRVYYAMAQDGLAFRWLGAVHARLQTPYLAIAAQALWACVLVATNSYRQLFTRVVYTEWALFALLAAGLFALHRRSGYSPRFIAGGYFVIPLLFIAGASAIVINQIYADPRGSAVGFGLILPGLPVYFVWSKISAKAGANAHH
jgi:APA family basic amino acid/polyamine antiporter